MTRQELCEQITALRKASDVKMKELCFQVDTMPTTIYRMESAKMNFDSKRLVNYLRALGYGIAFTKDGAVTVMSTYDDIPAYLKRIREQANHTFVTLSKDAECSRNAIITMEAGKAVLYVDLMCKLSEALGVQISIVKL